MDVRYATDEKMITCDRLINRHPREKRVNPLRFRFIRQLSFLIFIPIIKTIVIERKVYERRS